MRLYFLGVGAASAALKVADIKITDVHVLEQQDKELRAQEAEFTAERTRLDQKMRALGVSTDPEKQHADLHHEMKSVEAVAKKRSDNMSHEEAMDELKHHMTAEQHKEIALLVHRSKKGAKDEEEGGDDKKNYIRAIDTLNSLYLAVDDERIMLLANCENELRSLYMQMKNARTSRDQIVKQLVKIFGQYTKVLSYIWEQIDLWHSTQGELMEAIAMHDNGPQGLLALRAEKVVLEEDVALFRFIISRLEKKCSTDAKLGALLQKDEGEHGASCKKTCDTKMVHNAMLEVLSDPAVESEAKVMLNDHGVTNMKTLKRHLQEAESEQVSLKYTSFLQRRGHKSRAGEDPWELTTSDCGCNPEKLDCDSMMALMGLELECRKRAVDDKQMDITVAEAEKKKTTDALTQDLDNIKSRFNYFIESLGDAANEFRGAIPSYFEQSHKFWRLLWTARKEKFLCKVKYQDIQQNSYCAMSKIRKYIKNLAVEDLKLQEKITGEETQEAIQDCEVGDKLVPDGECMLNQEIVENSCTPYDKYDGKLPTLEHEIPKQTYRRDQEKTPVTDGGVQEFLNSTSLALACPKTMQLELPCAMHICPVDCKLSAFSEWGSCNVECDGGKRARTRTVMIRPLNGGMPCEETRETDSCNEDPCDVDCELHEWLATPCLQACSTSQSEQFYTMQRKVKVEAVNEGKCADFTHPDRFQQKLCSEHPTVKSDIRQCEGDEQCTDKMDLVLGYECSSSMGRLSCWYMASFVYELVGRFVANDHTDQAMNVALIKFGNGRAVPLGDTGKYTVEGAHLMSTGESSAGDVHAPFESDMMYVKKLILQDARKMFGADGLTQWRMGFNNAGMALQLGMNTLQDAGRSTDSAEIMKKVVLVTTGERIECSQVKAVGEGMKEKDYFFDTILMADGYESGKYPALESAVTYPPALHIFPVGMVSNFVNRVQAIDTVSGIVPLICPDASSPTVQVKRECDEGLVLVHKNRGCQSWDKELFGEGVDLMKCKAKAIEESYQSFTYNVLSISDGDDDELSKKTPNCFVHEEKSKLRQFIAGTWLPEESTCDYVPDPMQDQKDFEAKWVTQPVANTDKGSTYHYQISTKDTDCPRSNDLSTLFASKFVGEASAQ